MSNHFVVEAAWLSLEYSVNNYGGHGAEKSNSFGFGTDLRALTFGVVYKF